MNAADRGSHGAKASGSFRGESGIFTGNRAALPRDSPERRPRQIAGKVASGGQKQNPAVARRVSLKPILRSD